ELFQHLRRHHFFEIFQLQVAGAFGKFSVGSIRLKIVGDPRAPLAGAAVFAAVLVLTLGRLIIWLLALRGGIARFRIALFRLAGFLIVAHRIFLIAVLGSALGFLWTRGLL